jgi:hypothetical protein
VELEAEFPLRNLGWVSDIQVTTVAQAITYKTMAGFIFGLSIFGKKFIGIPSREKT